MSDQSTYRQELASAFLLGHASDQQVTEFEELFQKDPEFRAMVGDMEQFLAPLSTLTPEAEPPEGLLDEIMASIGEEPAPRVAPAAVEAPVRSHQRTPATHSARSAPQRPWQIATAAAVAVAAISLGFHAVPGAEVQSAETQPTAREELLALMSGEQTPNVVVLLYDKSSNKITGRLANTSLPEDGVWELWLLREGIDAPQSLGLLQELSESGSINLSIATELAAGSDTLAISVEPQGGSPEAGPTGPIIFTGKVNSI
ncbi:anti-sigma factor [Henriciella litoralis]|uniref:anti-sigma factor n=1 Tax=Henriciella litoralis TaxID=568102 RepID=UPI000A052223|nr:anti-sigma factor [Henriciella litoralis]